MKKLNFIADLEAGIELENEAFLMQDVMPRKTKDGRPYLLGNLRDKTGQVAFVFWDIPEYVQRWIRPGLVSLVTGRVVNYKEALQINITDLNQSHDPDMTSFLPTSRHARQDMIAELRQYIAALAEPWQALVTHLLLDDAFLTQFANAPAARHMHHAYIGGLLEHSLSMVKIAIHLAAHYPYVNKDLLVSGALLHDMGKALEYNVNESFDFSEDGRLVGHIVRAITMIEKGAAALNNFPEDKLRHLIHLVASHHGTHEWGAPIRPKTLEAILLHQIDLLDSRVQGYFDYLDNDGGEDAWTMKNSPMFGTPLRRPDGYTSEADSEKN